MGNSHFKGCQEEGCVTCCDEFDRPDASELGSDWQQQSGDWEIADGKLKGNTQGVAVYTRKVDSNVGTFMAIVSDVQLGCVYQLLAFQGTRQNPREHFACWILELAVTGGSAGNFTGMFSLKDPDGNTVCQHTAGIGATTGMSLTVGPERIQGASEASYDVMACRSSLSGTFFAVGNGSTTQPAVFTSVVYSQHYSENPECPQANCGCEGHCLPDKLIATAVNYQNCTNMQDMSWELQRGPVCESCEWNMETEYWNDDHCCMQLRFMHGGSEYGTSEASLSILREDVEWVALTLVESHCNPLYWKFCSARNPCESPVNGSWPCCEGTPPPPAPYGTQGFFCIEITPLSEP